MMVCLIVQRPVFASQYKALFSNRGFKISKCSQDCHDQPDFYTIRKNIIYSSKILFVLPIA